MLAVDCRYSSFGTFLVQIHNNTYIIGFYHLMHVSYTFQEAELVKAALQ